MLFHQAQAQPISSQNRQNAGGSAPKPKQDESEPELHGEKTTDMAARSSPRVHAESTQVQTQRAGPSQGVELPRGVERHKNHLKEHKHKTSEKTKNKCKEIKNNKAVVTFAA